MKNRSTLMLRIHRGLSPIDKPGLSFENCQLGFMPSVLRREIVFVCTLSMMYAFSRSSKVYFVLIDFTDHVSIGVSWSLSCWRRFCRYDFASHIVTSKLTSCTLRDQSRIHPIRVDPSHQNRQIQIPYHRARNACQRSCCC